MKLKTALKKKGQLIKEANFFDSKLHKYNCVPVENAESRDYDPKDSLSKWLEKINELVAIKTKIQRANMPVFEKILRMAELKGIVRSLVRLDCHTGVLTDETYQKTTIYESVISARERDELIQKFENEIAQLQDELDEFNLLTTLE